MNKQSRKQGKHSEPIMLAAVANKSDTLKGWKELSLGMTYRFGFGVEVTPNGRIFSASKCLIKNEINFWEESFEFLKTLRRCLSGPDMPTTTH